MLAILAGCCALEATAGDTDPKKKAGIAKDTTVQVSPIADRGFKELFVPNENDPTQPYKTTLNPIVIPFVEDYLKKHEKHLNDLKGWAGPYFSMMDNILMSYGLPKELKYLAVIESNLRAYAQSWAGAVGPWQFMPETGRRMGLRINSAIDERTDYYKSTHAAAKYLKELHNSLGDWLLVIAAYNGGPGRVESAIRRSGSNNFWQLQYYLPEESRNHVKKFISTHYVMEGSGGLTTSTKAEWTNHQVKMADQVLNMQTQINPQLLANTSTTEVQGRYNSVVLANYLAMDILSFNALNPGFDQMVVAEKGYSLRLPNDKIEQFKANRYNILYQSIMLTMQKANDPGAGYPSADPKPVPKVKSKEK
jgi:membrane-bound lytic murein transglycosylase D